jgi:chemotaxis protein CheY-P-specific phosphatase CheC
MEKQSLMASMKASISEVMETMFFLPLEFEDGGDIKEIIRTAHGGTVACKLAFSGPFSGFSCFLIPVKVAQGLTASFLGEDTARVPEEQMAGTVKEILNMITGKAFSLYDNQAVFKLGFPEIIPPAKWTHLLTHDVKEVVNLYVNTADGNLGLSLVIFS